MGIVVGLFFEVMHGYQLFFLGVPYSLRPTKSVVLENFRHIILLIHKNDYVTPNYFYQL